MELSAQEKARWQWLSDHYFNTLAACQENAMDMGFEPDSPEEMREVMSQVENLIEAGEAS